MQDPVTYATIEGASAPAFSLDGRTLFHLRGSGAAQLWSLDLDNGYSRALTEHDEKVSLVRRAPNDDRVIYAIDAGGDERHQLWLWDAGEQRPLTDNPAAVHNFGAWSPDGAQITLTTNDRDPAHLDLLVMTVATGERLRLMNGTHEANAGGWTKAADRVLVTQDRSTADQRPFVVTLDGQAAAVPCRRPTRFASLRWDGDALLGLVEVDGFMALCQVDPATGAITPEVAAAGRDIEAWALSGTGILATVENERGYSVLRFGPRGGERSVVALPTGVVSDLAWSSDGSRLAFAFSAPTRPSGLWLWDGSVARPVWEPPCDVPLRPFDLVQWSGLDGMAVPGWLALPDGEAPAAGWPALIWVHGGPASQARGNIRPDMQALLAQGYAVLMPNVRGSTGYGRAVMDADDVERRLDSVHDLAAGRRWLAAQPGIDPDRIAVMGQSYGGYMVLAAVTEYPDLWRCAIDFYGIADFETLLAATGPWRRAHRAAEYGDSVRHRALFDRISPIRHVDRIVVPLLVLHGTRDPRVAIGESEQIVAALRERQRPVSYEVFDYAGHGFVRSEDKARVYRTVAAFLSRHL